MTTAPRPPTPSVWAACVCTVVLIVLSGCLSGEAATDSDAPKPVRLASTGILLDRTPIIAQAVDRWGSDTEIILYEGTVNVFAQECADVNRLQTGCGAYQLPPFVKILEGTRALRIEANVGGATTQGTWTVWIDSTYGRTWATDPNMPEGERTAAASQTWTLPLEPRDWDPSTLPVSPFAAGVGAIGQGSILDGPVQVTVTAEKDPTWVPLPTRDRFYATDADSPAAGVLTLLDTNVTLTCPTWPGAFSCGLSPQMEPIPPTTTHLALVASTGPVTGCAPTGPCNLRMPMFSGGRMIYQDSATIRSGTTAYRAIVYDIRSVGADGPYVNVSGTRFGLWIDQCAPGTGCTPYHDGSAVDLWMRIEAWQDVIDLEGALARVGVAI